jgi:hypothetical protein
MKHSNEMSELKSAVVQVIACGDLWFVRVVENGVERSESYCCEADAMAHAERDRSRLNLEGIERIL